MDDRQDPSYFNEDNMNFFVWNMGSYKTHKHAIFAELNSFKYDGLFLQETLTTDNIFKTEVRHELESLGFRVFHSAVDSLNHRKGMISGVRATHPSELKKCTYINDKEVHIIQVKVPGGFIELQNHYWNPSLPNLVPQLYPHLPHAKKCYDMGDFNIHHTSLQGNYDNKFGKGMRKILDQSDISHIPTKQPTTKANTYIDKVFTSSNLKKLTKVKVLDVCSGGSKAGHYALHVSTRTAKYADKDDFIPKIKFDSENFPKFKACLENKLNKKDIFDDIRPDNVDESARLLAEAYHEAVLESFSQTKYHDHPWRSWYWSPKCEEARNRVNYWTRVNRKRKLFIPGAKQKLVDAKVYAQKTYDEAILLAWPKICESLTLAKNDSKNWKRIMYVKRGGIPPPKVKHQNPETKAAELADSFAQRTHSDNLSQKVRDTLANLSDMRNLLIQKALNTPDNQFDHDITEFEIENVSNINKSTAPGDDKITYPMIKNSGPTAKTITQKIYNVIWNSGKLVNDWKIAAQIPLP